MLSGKEAHAKRCTFIHTGRANANKSSMLRSMTAERSILLIDDDGVLRDLYRVKFKRAGFSTLEAGNGQEAITLLAKGAKPDAILLDLIMPVMDGIAFLQEAKHKALTLPPLIVFTSQEGDIDKVKAFAFGANQFVQKATATPKMILEKVEMLLQQKQAAQAL